MINLAVTMIIKCPSITKVLDYGQEWDYCQDEDVLDYAKVKCRIIFGAEKPCLVWFIKSEQGVYKALCGGKR